MCQNVERKKQHWSDYNVGVYICVGSLKEQPHRNTIGCCSVDGKSLNAKVKVKAYSIE